MKTLEWTPAAIHVAERRDQLVALLVHDYGEMVVLPLSRSMARELGAGLVALADELDERFGPDAPLEGAEATEIRVDGPMQ